MIRTLWLAHVPQRMQRDRVRYHETQCVFSVQYHGFPRYQGQVPVQLSEGTDARE